MALSARPLTSSGVARMIGRSLSDPVVSTRSKSATPVPMIRNGTVVSSEPFRIGLPSRLV